MNPRSQPDEDTVTVHVSPRGGLHVKPAELLRSKAAQAMIAKMDRVLRADSPTRVCDIWWQMTFIPAREALRRTARGRRSPR